MTAVGPVQTEATQWLSAITETLSGHIRIRGHEITDLMGQVSFGEALYLLWMGQPAPRTWAPVLNALLIAAIDHGPGSPSALTARTVISGGGALNAAAAAGLLTMGQFHGAAINDAMTLLYEVQGRAQEGVDTIVAVDAALATWRATHRRFPGLGHRLHHLDPRVERLWSIAREAGLPGDLLTIEQHIASRASALVGKPLPINIDGAMAGVLCEMHVPATLGNAFFYVARLGGLLAHAHEEQQRMPPMRRIHPTAYTYDGPHPEVEAAPAQTE